MGAPRIFVSIASYRDTEGPPTITDLFAKAARPERIQVGVLWQVIPDEDRDCIGGVAPEGQVRSLTVHASESLGACWARSRILDELREDEEFVLQIDSHSRFAPGWDESFIAMHRSCPSDKAVLSSYPVRYLPPDSLGDRMIPIQAAGRFNDHGVLTFHSRSLAYEDRPQRPLPSAFVGAGCIFAPSAAFDEVPYDPFLYFHGEEVTMAVRLWTHGWDLFTPNDVLLYHDYTTDRGRPRHWSDNRDWPTLNQRSFARIRHLLTGEAGAEPEALRELDRYGLGCVRTLAEYERFADLEFRRRTIGWRALDGRFPAPAEESRFARERMFGSIFRSNAWGCKETRSGPGSTLVATRAMRKLFGQLLGRLRIRSILDAGCGDLNWIEGCLEGIDLYVGIDIAAEVIEYNLACHGGRPGIYFNRGDVVSDRLPKVDAILCRHVLTHLPDSVVQDALANFKRSGSRYLIATSHPAAENRNTKEGSWRPLELRRAPFNLPPARYVLQDGQSCQLCVWDMHSW